MVTALFQLRAALKHPCFKGEPSLYGLSEILFFYTRLIKSLLVQTEDGLVLPGNGNDTRHEKSLPQLY